MRDVRQQVRAGVIDSRFRDLYEETDAALQGILSDFKAGAIGKEQFSGRLAARLEQAYLQAARLGKQKAIGDRRRKLSGADRAAVRSELAEDEDYARDFRRAIEMEAGSWPDDKRMRAYSRSLMSAFNNSFRAHLEGAETVWVRHALDSCETCIEEASQPPRVRTAQDRVPGDGSTKCVTGCKCTLVVVGRKGLRSAPPLPHPLEEAE